MNIDQTQIDQTQQEEQSPPAATAVPAVRELVHRAEGVIDHADEVQIEVERVADLLTDGRSRLRRGAIYRGWMLASPLCGLILLAGVANQELITIGLSALALTAIYTMGRQAELLQQARTALRHAALGPEWLGALAEALEWPDRRVRSGAGLLLPVLLPRLAAGAPDPFAPEQKLCLYRRLTRRAAAADPELALAILRALPVIGTGEALPLVRRLAAMSAFSRDRRRVRDAARASLLALEQRIVKQNAPGPTAANAVHPVTANAADPSADERT